MNNIYQSISNTRTQLMGIAIFSVCLSHILMISESKIFILSLCLNWIYTEGFLFLSGLGIYNSLHNDNCVKSFYKRRIKRVFLPFLIIAGPFILFLSLWNDAPLWLMLLRLTTLNFWYEGNFGSLWYISVIMLLYLLSPLFYHILRSRLGGVKFIIVFFMVFSVIEYLRHVLYADSFRNYQWIVQIPSFLIGMFIAKINETKSNMSNVVLVLMILLQPIISIGLGLVWDNSCYYPIIQKIGYTILFAALLDNIRNHNGSISKALSWLGKYSLEIYMLHMLIYEVFKVFNEGLPTFNILASVLISLCICTLCRRYTEYCKKMISV